ncbi:MAG: glutamyl-tRNA reductase [Lachnospiraceae bacterium]|nr:glutamyl-tRNA reductase [Lachnospiraceae bacterium]
MSIQLIGVSYQYAPINIREKFAFSKEEQQRIMEHLIMKKEIEECILVSTCNRTELYCYGNDQSGRREVFSVMQKELLADTGLENEKDVSTYLRFYQDQKASGHLFRVAAGLDSMVIGEDQILGQIKDAHEQAMHLGTTGVWLNTLFRYAVTGAKKVKTDTELSKTPVSTASLAIKAAAEALGGLSGKKVMVIGASGKIGSIVLKNLAAINDVEIYATTRRTNLRHRGIVFTQVLFEDRYQFFDQMDVIISATSSPHYTITKRKFEEHISTKKQRVLIDLAVPMDLEKSVREINGVHYYNIDDFESIAELNNEKKKKEAEAADLILEDYEDKFEQWRIFKNYMKTMDVVCDFLEKESCKKGIEHAVRKLFYQVRDSAAPEGLECFFRSLEERNKQWED